MIDISKILKRAWYILWNYRILWIFGLLLAITAGGGIGSNPQVSYQTNRQDWQNMRSPTPLPQFLEEMNQWIQVNVNPLFATETQAIHTAIWIVVGLLIFFMIVGTLVALVRYPTETAVIRMVDEYEQTGTKVGFKQGWKMGWSRAAFRLWVIDFIVSLPAFLFVLVLLGVGVTLYYSIQSGAQALAVAGTVAAIGCLFVFILVFAVGMVFLTLLKQFFWRAAVLEDTGVRDSFRRGWEIFKGNWKSGILIWLVMIGLAIAFGIASVLLIIVLIPVMLVTLLAGLIVAGIPGALFGGLVSLFAPTWVAVLVGALIFLPIFFTVGFSPYTLVSGWVKIFESNVWTLTYREMKVLGSLQADKELPPLVPEQTA